MKKCPRCGAENDDTAKFCNECGAPFSTSDYTNENRSIEEKTYGSARNSADRSKLKTCRSCGKLIDKKAKRCPYCNAKQKKPFYKKIWFWILIFLLLIIIIGSLSGNSSSEETSQKQEQTGIAEKKTEGTETRESNGTKESNEIKEEKQAEIVGISALYSGDTEAGTVLDENNAGITVEEEYDDGSQKETDDWTIEEPLTLEAGQTSTVTITAGDYSTELSVTCTTTDPESYKESCEDIAYDDIARNPDDYTGRNIHFYGKVIQVQESGNDVMLRVSTRDSGYGNWYEDVVLVAYTRQDGESRILEDDFVDIYGICAGTTTYQSVLGGDITIPSMSAQYIDIEE